MKSFGWLNRIFGSYGWGRGVVSGGVLLYEYGWPSGGSIEPNVAFQLLFDEASSPIVDEVGGVSIPEVSLGSSQLPTYSETGEGSAPWGNLEPSCGFLGRGAFETGATTALNLGTSDAVIEMVYTISSQANNLAILFDTRDVTNGYGYAVGYNKNLNRCLIYLTADDGTLVSLTLTGGTFTDPFPTDYHKYRTVLDRSGSAEYFIDGDSWGTGSISTLSAKTISANNVLIGSIKYPSGPTNADSYRGYIAELRVTIGNTTNNSGGPGGG